MESNKQTIQEFTDALASKAPAPGGGGASALCGALGTALSSMVANLTVGKKKYAAYETELQQILQKAEALQQELLVLIDKDAEAFLPLSRAYSLPKDTEEERRIKDEVMEQALKDACGVPLAIMEKAQEAISLHEELETKGSTLAQSDVGVGVLFLKSALIGASLNVYINTKMMKNTALAHEYNKKADDMIARGSAMADDVFQKVMKKIR